MSSATSRSEVIRRMSAGELPTVADLIVVKMRAGGGTCRGCGNTLSAGEPRCLVDCATASSGPLSMHAGCFLVWSEACLRSGGHADHTRKLDGSTGATAVDSHPPAWQLKKELFCKIRLELLNQCVRSANEFAEAVRWIHASWTASTQTACEQARAQLQLAREAYEEHIRDHRC